MRSSGEIIWLCGAQRTLVEPDHQGKFLELFSAHEAGKHALVEFLFEVASRSQRVEREAAIFKSELLLIGHNSLTELLKYSVSRLI